MELIIKICFTLGVFLLLTPFLLEFLMIPILFIGFIIILIGAFSRIWC